MTFWIWFASSRVGARHSAWVSRRLVSMLWRIEMEKVAVLPVPDCACAIVSWPFRTGRMPICCIADGFSKP
jgi:hypothetical protein